MKFKNQTAVSEFLLVGLTEDPELQPLIFILFLSMYLVTLLGNLLIILAVGSDSHLHTPMYFFLSSLSFTDICISTSTIPKMLVNVQTQDRSVTYTGCLTQSTFVLTFAGVESCLLAVMAYDCYVAICQPLRYQVILMLLCVLLVLLSLLISSAHALLHILMALRLSFCTDLEIPHFFCELAQIFKLACSDIFINTLLIYSAANIFFGVPIAGIIFSYTKIVSSVFRMASAGGRYKAFSTCGSHLFVVSLFYGMGFGVYLSSAVTDSSTKNAVASVMYIVIPQMMNPFIYSLRNKEIKTALRLLITGKPFICWLINNVEAINQTAVSEFSLQGLTADPALQPLIFSLFLSIYLVTTLGNLLIILVVSSETHLHTPMYFFLSILSFNDICFSTSTIPKMLMNIRTQSRSITYTGCLTQAGFVMISAFLENFLLTVMAYDRYAAICHPLRYTVIMNPRSCVLLVLVSVLINTADSLLHTLMLLQLSFCTDLGIPHFFCELAQLIKLACSDSTIDDILIYVSCCVCAGIPLSGIIYSYIHIVSSILRISSSGGKYKAFSTCGSHLSVVSLFYGAGLGVYISSAVTDSPRKTAVASVMYSVLPQMLNPFIYSIRNKDMKEALRRRITRKVSLL
ncbi:LOW QUALITY PROTEIN: uncharacterized protein O8D03_008426 [Erethizon dorsatum]